MVVSVRTGLGSTMSKLPLLVVFFLCLATYLIAISGCGQKDHSSASEQSSAASTTAINQKVEKDGIMARTDSEQWERLGTKVSRTKQLDDADVDWAISMMHKPSTVPAVVHAQMMGLFLDMRTFSPSQREKILQAVTPLLSSTNPMDRKYAQAVIRRMS